MQLQLNQQFFLQSAFTNPRRYLKSTRSSMYMQCVVCPDVWDHIENHSNLIKHWSHQTVLETFKPCKILSFSVSSHVSVNVLSCTQRTLWSTHQRLYQSSVFIPPAENCFLCLVWWWFIRTQWKGAHQHQHQATAWLEVRTSFKIFRWCWKQTCAVHAPWVLMFWFPLYKNILILP